MAHERRRLWVGSRRDGDVVVADWMKKAARRRCSRRRPASCSAPASPPTRMAPSSPAATGPAPLVHRRSPAAACRRRHDARLAPLRLHSPAHLRRRSQEKGKTPTRVGGKRQRPRGLPMESRSRRCEGREGRRCSYWWTWRDG
jgi:hypothetical protein